MTRTVEAREEVRVELAEVPRHRDPHAEAEHETPRACDDRVRRALAAPCLPRGHYTPLPTIPASRHSSAAGSTITAARRQQTSPSTAASPSERTAKFTDPTSAR